MTPTDDQLLRFLAGTLSADEAAGVASWAESDPAAEARLASLGTTDTLARALLGSGGTPFPTGDAAGKALADLTTELAPAEPDGTDPSRPAGYKLRKELGRGGMGVVFEAEDVRLGRRVAIKMMLPEVAARADAKARFLREARAMAAVESEYIVPVLHVGETADGTPYLVMPLLRGETLADRLERGPLSGDALRAVAGDAARGLAAAHARGLIHRDVKPSNLWLEADPDGTVRRVRLLDFGLARPVAAVGALTGTHVVVGTPKYMSPEQARGERVGPPSDLFSLGAVLYRAATDHLPFDGDTITAVLTALAVAEPTPMRDLAPAVPVPFAALTHDLLRKVPAERPTADDVLARLTPTDPPPRGRHRTWLAVAAGFAAVLAAAGVIVIRNGKTEVQLGDGVKAKVTNEGDKTVIDVGPPPGRPAELLPPPRPAPTVPPAEEWEARTRRLPRAEQLAEVLAELRRRNPDARPDDFTIQLTRANDTAGELTAAWINTDELRDLTPLRAVTAGRLHRVYLRAQAKPKAFTALEQLRGVPVDGLALNGLHGVTDLTASKGLPLTFLDLTRSPVRDLTPLAGMPLKTLHLQETAVADLTPIRNLKLTYINYGRSFDPTGVGGIGRVSSLEPLRDMPLERLDLGECLVRDLRPVPLLRLKQLHLGVGLADLSPLAGSRIESLSLTDAEPHVAAIKGLPQLRVLNASAQAPQDGTPSAVLDAIELRQRRDAEFRAAAAKLTGEKLIAAVTAELEARQKTGYQRFGGRLPDNWKPNVVYEQTDGKVVGVAILNEVLDLSPLAVLPDVRKLSMTTGPLIGSRFHALTGWRLEELSVQTDWRHHVSPHVGTLARMTGLKTVNGRPYADFRKEYAITPAGQ